MTETYSFEILAELKAARASVDQFSKETQQNLDKINFRTTVTAIRDGFDLARQFIGGVRDLTASFVNEALEADSAQRQLANAMRLTGEFTEASAEAAKEYADQLARVTRYSDDQVTSALALAKSYQLSNSEAKRLVTVATDLAAVTGTDLNTAVRKLAESYGENLRGLQKQFPELKKFSDEQLRAGAAVEFLGAKLRGSAQNDLQSYAGQIDQARKEVNEFQESIGFFLLRSAAVYIRWGKTAVKAISDVGYEQQKLLAQMSNETLFDKVGKAYDRLQERQKVADAEAKAERQARAARDQAAAETQAKRELEAFKANFLDKKKEIQLRSLTEQQRIEQEFQNDILVIAKGYGQGLIKDTDEYLKLIYGLKEQQAQKELALLLRTRREAEAAEERFDQERRQRYEQLAKSPIREMIKFGASIDTRDAMAVGAGLLSSIAKGAKGAQSLLSGGIADLIGFAVGGPLGQAIVGPVSEMIALLGQGPEVTRQTVQEFVRAIPEFIRNLVEALPVLIQTLVEELPPALAKTMPQVAIGFTTALIANIPNIIKGFIEGMKEVPRAIVEGIKQGLDQLFKGISSVGGLFGGGGGGSVLGGALSFLSPVGGVVGGAVGGFLGDVFGFAEGGEVPDAPTGRGDRMIARVDAGETIVDRSTTEALKDMIRNGAAGRQPDIVINIGLQQFARIMFDARKAGYQL